MSSGEARRRSSVEMAAMRDAMCTRIRTLGCNILSITRAAMLKVEELDAEHERRLEQQRKQRESSQRQQQQQQMQLSPRPNVNVKGSRCTKSVPNGVATRLQARPTLQVKSAAGAKNSAGVAAAAAPPLASAPKQSMPRADTAACATRLSTRSPGSAPCGSSGKKRSKQRRSPSPSVNAAPLFTPNTSGSPSQQMPATHMSHNKVVEAATQSKAPTDPSGSASTFPREFTNGHVSSVINSAAFVSESVIADICQSAEHSFQRILDLTNQEQEDSVEHRGAPLYDLSNAASTCHNSEHNTNVSALQQRGAAVENGKSNNSTTVVDGGVVLSAQAYMEVRELPEDASHEVFGHAATAAAAATSAKATPQPVSNYYRVVYIHQSTRVRLQSGSSPGSGYSSGRSGVQRRRLTPNLGSPGRMSPSTHDREDEEEPRMVNSFVSAMYAVVEGRSSIISTGGVEEGQQAAAAAAAAEPAVQVELRVPVHHPGSGVLTRSASATSTPPTGAFCFPAVGIAETESRAQDDTESSLRQTGPTMNYGSDPTPESSSRVDNNVDEAVAAQIKTMEGWRHDRHTSVEQRIRQRRHSSVVAQGWQGEYYYYASPAKPAVSALPLPAFAPTPAEATAAGDEKPHGAGVSPINHNEMHGAAPPLPSVSEASGSANSITEAAQAQFSTPPLRPQSSPSGSSHFSTAWTGSVCGPLAVAAITYDVLLQTRQSASTSSTPRSLREGTAPALEDQKDAASDETKVATTGATSMAACAPRQSIGAAAAAVTSGGESDGRSRRRRRPRLEVVVASDYNLMEWAFAGEARRASVLSEDATAVRSGTLVHGDGAADAAMAANSPSTPLWTAHQRRVLAEEEHRGWSARTRQPRSADIHAPIVLNVSI